MKPFIETLRVTNPVRQSRASSRKRVLRGERRLSLRSVDSEFKRCVCPGFCSKFRLSEEPDAGFTTVVLGCLT